MVTAEIFPFKENSHGRAGNRTLDLMISSQRLRQLDHEAGLSEIFSIKNGLKKGDALSPLLFNCALDYAIWIVEVYHDGFKLDQLLVYADYYYTGGKFV